MRKGRKRRKKRKRKKKSWPSKKPLRTDKLPTTLDKAELKVNNVE